MDFARALSETALAVPPLKRFRRLYLLFILARPVNLIIFLATGGLAAYLLYREHPEAPMPWTELGWLLGSAVLIMAGGYWLNDVYDVEIDAINRPRRAARVRLLTRRYLLEAVLTVWMLGMLCTIPLWWTFMVLHLLVILLLFWYNRYGKRLGLIGNLLVAILTALLPWEIMLLTARTAYAVDWMIPLAAVFNFAREVVKDAEDQAGDERYGVRSLPTRLHPSRWRSILCISWVSLIVFIFIPALMKYILWRVVPVEYLLFVTVGAALPLLWGLFRLSDYRLLSRLLKVAMGGGLVALAFL